jgi:hypothetical protein
MKATITINMDNAAFTEDGCDGYDELARILKRLANDLQDNGFRERVLMDTNGNFVGKFETSIF